MRPLIKRINECWHGSRAAASLPRCPLMGGERRWPAACLQTVDNNRVHWSGQFRVSSFNGTVSLNDDDGAQGAHWSGESVNFNNDGADCRPTDGNRRWWSCRWDSATRWLLNVLSGRAESYWFRCMANETTPLEFACGRIAPPPRTATGRGTIVRQRWRQRCHLRSLARGTQRRAAQRWFPFTADGITVPRGKGKPLKKSDGRKCVRSWTRSTEKSGAVYTQKCRRGDDTQAGRLLWFSSEATGDASQCPRCLLPAERGQQQDMWKETQRLSLNGSL